MEYKLYRCKITSENDKYFIGRDALDKKYYIAKNNATQNYKVGTDDSFYATITEEGAIFKKKVLWAISSKEYEKKVIKNRNCNVSDEDLLERLRNI